MRVGLAMLFSILLSSQSFANVVREHCLTTEDEGVSCFIEVEENGRSQLYTSPENHEYLFLDQRVANLNLEFVEVSEAEYSRLRTENAPKMFVYANQTINVVDFDSALNCSYARWAWWDDWGKCAAGTIGGAGLGGLGGASFGPIGIGVGVVAGGLSGAAASCGSTITIRYRGQEITQSVNC